MGAVLYLALKNFSVIASGLSAYTGSLISPAGNQAEFFLLSDFSIHRGHFPFLKTFIEQASYIGAELMAALLYSLYRRFSISKALIT